MYNSNFKQSILVYVVSLWRKRLPSVKFYEIVGSTVDFVFELSDLRPKGSGLLFILIYFFGCL